MSWWTEAKNALTFHGDPGRFGNVQRWSDMPGSPVSLMHAISANDWTHPYGSENSFDRFAGGGSSGQPWARGAGRTVGTLAAILTGGGALSGGESGASEVGSGFPLSEEAGGAGPEGQLSGPSGSSGTSLADYLRRYGRQGANLMSRMGQGGGGGRAASVEDNSMIAPIPIADPYAESAQGISPEIMALLLNASSRQGDGGTYGLG